MNLLNDFLQTRIDNFNYENLKKTFKIKVPENFNFAYDVVDRYTELEPEKLAMLWISDSEEIHFTFKDISNWTNKTANYFVQAGLKKGDAAMLILRRRWEFWPVLLALHKIGAVAIPATHLLTEKDFLYRFETADVSALICTGDGNTAHQAELAVKQYPKSILKIMAHGERDGWHCSDKEISGQSYIFERPSGKNCPSSLEPMLMFFTSGTTGYPKAVVHSYQYPLGHFLTARYWHNTDPNGMHFTISDTGWAKALWGKLYGQWLNETAVFVYDFDKFNAHSILSVIEKYPITTFCAPPTMYRFFIKEDLSKYDLSSVKYATVAGEALNPEIQQQFFKATGIQIMEGFGQSETTVLIGNFIGTTAKLGSMGKASVLYDVDLLLPDGTSAPVGETGEIVVRTHEKTPCGLFLGYYNSKYNSIETWKNQIYHTGDTAWRDEEGYFWYVSRVDDIIKSSGYRIGPFEIESIIMELPYVLECGVSSVPDPLRGQVVKASVVLTQGTAPTEELKKEIQNYVKTHTAPYKYPRIVEFCEELPKTISGKIKRSELRKYENISILIHSALYSDA